jgi:hypothetical protein
VAALQFRNESFAAIDAIDTMRRKELAAPPRSPAEIRRSFIQGILNSKREINQRLIELAIEPNRPPEVPEWDEFVKDLKNQYQSFAAIFDRLEERTVVSPEEVRRAAEHARTLTVQMALLTDAIQNNPPILTQYRTRVIVQLRRLRQDYQTLQAQLQNTPNAAQLLQRQTELENQTGQMLDEWQQIRQDEQILLETTVTQCTKAVVMGKELIDLANRYEELSLGDLNTLVPQILTTAASLTGRDYSTIQSRMSRVIAELQSDPLWSNLTRTLTDQINSAAYSRTSNDTPVLPTSP